MMIGNGGGIRYASLNASVSPSQQTPDKAYQAGVVLNYTG